MQLIIKKFFIISLFIVFLTPVKSSYSNEKSLNDFGIIALMYHRFEENKYPSTNIKINDFREHINLIQKEGLEFINANNFKQNLEENKLNRKILITIDDAFLSFYENAWPIFKKEKIPFILFVNTREIGSYNYMSWEQLREIAQEEFVYIGNHSHSHEYLVDKTSEEIYNDINTSILIIKEKLNLNPEFFSYPFGEYSIEFKRIIKKLGFKYAFGQHSGVIDETKDYYELPRFPINEKYGEKKRFQTLLKTIPLKYKKILPEEKLINDSTNPPDVSIEFYNTVKNINCYSNEENKWKKSEIIFIDEKKIKIKLIGKFTTERGRINCSIREENGFWKWLGIQFVVSEK